MKVLITAGGTIEKIDDVRAISNNSTGRLGAAIAEAFLKATNLSVEKIFYICGQNAVVPLSEKIDIRRIGGVAELASQIESILLAEQIDVVIHSMAVSDYTVSSLTTISNVSDAISEYLMQDNIKEYSPIQQAAQIVSRAFDEANSINSGNKVSSDIDDLVIVMKKTPKVISTIKALSPRTILVGFKLLSNVSLNTLIDTGYSLLQKNSCDLVLANDLRHITQNKHKGYLIASDRTFEAFETKAQIAEGIVERVTDIFRSRGRA